MKNVLLILVGGTICTKVNEDGFLSIDDKAGIKLKDNFYKSTSFCVNEVNIELTENMNILSENMTVEKWNDIISLYRQKVYGKKYDGVIFAHGTDTLAFSSSLFSMLLADTEIPVFFVSANKKLGSPHSNGDANFRYAIECICRGISPNVYVTYENLSDNQMYLHLASRLKQCKNHSEAFYSEGAINITNITDANYSEYFRLLESKFPSTKRNALVSLKGDWKLSNCVLMITPYVGLSYNAFDYSNFSAVLHGTYHSGTLCAKESRDTQIYGENSILSMIDTMIDNNSPKDIYISPCKLSGEMYETIPTVANYRKDEIKNKFNSDMNVVFLYGPTFETTYAKLLIAYSFFESKDDIKNFLDEEINFETAYV